MTAVRELEEETGSASRRRRYRTRSHSALSDPAPIPPRYAPDVQENIEHAFALELPADSSPAIRLSEHTEYGWFTSTRPGRKLASWTNRERWGDIHRRLTASGRRSWCWCTDG